MPDYIPIKPGEANKLQLFFGCAEVLGDVAPHIENRLKSVGKWPQFRSMQTWSRNMCDALTTTMEPQKRNHFLLNLSNHEIRVVCKGSINTTKDRIVVAEDDLLWLILDALNQHCAVCMGSSQDMRKCKLRKHLKNLTLFDLDESGGVCMGKQIERRNDI